MAESGTPRRVTRGSIAAMESERRTKKVNDHMPLNLLEEIEHAKLVKRKKRSEVKTNLEKRRKVNSIDSSECEKRAVEQDQEENEIEEIRLYVVERPIEAPHMQVYGNHNIVHQLKEKLTPVQFQKFKNTCFGVYTKMHECRVQNQIFRCFMVCELQNSSSDTLLIRINGTTLRFGIREFAIISGLNCVADPDDFSFNKKKPNRIIEQFFGGKKNVIKKAELIRKFDKKVWGDGNDDDAVKFAILYFINTFIFSKEKTSSSIPRSHFDLVESGRYSDYPWGIKAFAALLKTVSKKMDAHKKYYRIAGMPLAMQVWLYECCSSVDKKIASKVSNRIPRLLNWRTKEKRPHYEYLMEEMFKDNKNPLTFQNISPSLKEIALLQIPSKDAVFDTALADEDVDEDEDDDFTSKPPSDVPKNKGKEKGNASSDVPKNKRGSSINETPHIVETEKKSDSKSDEIAELRQDFAAFKKSVTGEFKELRLFIVENLKDVLDAINVSCTTKESFQTDDIGTQFPIPDFGKKNSLNDNIQQSNVQIPQLEVGVDEPEESFVFVVPVQSLDMNVKTTEHVQPASQFELIDELLPSLNSVKKGVVNSKAVVDEVTALPIHSKAIVDLVTPLPIHSKAVVDEVTPLQIHSKAVVDEVTPLQIHSKAVVDEVTPLPIHSKAIVDLVTPLPNHSKVVVDEVTPLPIHSKVVVDEVTPLPIHSKAVVDEVTPLPMSELDVLVVGIALLTPPSLDLHLIHPFVTDFIRGPHNYDVFEDYAMWLREGLLVKHTHKLQDQDHYKKNKAELAVHMDLGIHLITNKNWFYTLSYDGQLLNDEHIDVVLYYLRKKSKYGVNSRYKYTTVDCLFKTKIADIYAAYANIESKNCVANIENDIREYINGYRLMAAIPWNTIDNVLIPVNVKQRNHWVLVVLSLVERHIHVYDSYRAAKHDSFVREEIQKLAQLLPMYLSMYYDDNMDDTQDLNIPFDVTYVKDIPQQRYGSMDCGLYLLAFAEYLSDGNDICVETIDAELLRIRYGALLWEYAAKKMEDGAVSDNEAPPKLNRKPCSEMDSSEIVMIN
ncbi:hypothetical protein MTR67_048348 [Solanum verrucosum]|uniref:Ubiquitin-like protease family profile domain-containing protein n=1 Tax=Solanum verrucosum TaxID=315347 RepID=A0AAF0ZZ43_SOLVR|nr:hypothetical protein MTR67_048348 [Solanum verrucosum]